MCFKAVIGISFVVLVQKQLLVENFPRNEHNLDITEQPYTDTGYLIFKGSYMKTRKGRLVSAFRGITYALAERFEPPQTPLYSKKGIVVDAATDGKVCPQAGMLQETMEENCLRLNVYRITPNPLRPNTIRESQPVIVYFHDGAFYNGSARSDLAGPQYLLDRDLVLVTVQYRIGPFGFLSTGSVDSPGNYGLKDQVAALQWVRKYIIHFGGNPDCVTIAGSGAGAESAILHIVSPLSRGLFHRVIAMGGSPTTQAPLPTNQLNLAKRLAHLVNCPADETQNMVMCLKRKPYWTLSNSLAALYEFGYDPIHIWRPVVEKDFNQSRFLTDLPERTIKAGLHQRVPLMIGRTELDYAWRAYSVTNDPALLKEMNEEWDQKSRISFELGETKNTTDREIAAAIRRYYLDDRHLMRNEFDARRLGRVYTDAINGYAIYRLINLMTEGHVNDDKIESNVYYYQFSYQGPYSHFHHEDTGRSVGAVHGDELLYILGMPAKFPLIAEDSSNESRMVDFMTERIYLFCSYGNPNFKYQTGHMPYWVKYEEDNHAYLNINVNSTVAVGLNEDIYTKLWDMFYSKP